MDGPRTDCPICGAAGSVGDGFCEVCYAEPDRGAADLPPAGPEPSSYRMTDVIAEIRSIGLLAADPPSPDALADACARAERLLRGLRRQFVAEVVVGRPVP